MTDHIAPTGPIENRPTGLRTHLCGVLRTSDQGARVRVCGWVGRRREHGEHLAFIDLRDHTGVVQCVIDTKVDVRSEWVIAIEGTVRHRPEGTVNPGLATGEIELGECTVVVLNEAEPPPFSVDDRDESDEQVRLRYRYIDLRRPAHAGQPAPPGARQRRHSGGHGPAGLLRGGDAAPLGPDARRLPRVLGPEPAPSRIVLRVAAEPAAGQAAADGGRLRPLLPDRPLLARRGPAGRPPVRVLPTRHGGLVCHAGRRDGLRVRGGARCGGGRHRRAAAPDRPHDLVRRARTLRNRQARPALRHGAGRPGGGVRAYRGARVLGSHLKAMCVPDGASFTRSRLDALGEHAKRAGAAGLAWFRVIAADGGGAHLRFTAQSVPVGYRAGGSPGEDRCEGGGSHPGRLRHPPDRLHDAGHPARRVGLSAGRAGPAPLRLGRRLPHVRRGRRDREPAAGPSPVHHAVRGGSGAPRHRPLRRALAGLRPRPQRLGTGIGECPYPPPGHPVAHLRHARDQRRGGREPGSASCSARSATARRRTPASPSASIAWWRSWPGRRTSAR